jgi:F-type H+-transporting ATPase subunit delta
MRNHRAATRYAKSLLQLAQESSVLDQVRDDMQLFLKVFAENRLFSVLLRNPVILHSKKRAVLQALFKDKMDRLTLVAFDLITKKNRENILHEIAGEFLVQYNILQGIQKAVVTTTYPLADDETAEFNKVVRGITGLKPEIELKVDEDIIGGFVLDIGDRQLDESVKSKLNKIKRELTT